MSTCYNVFPKHVTMPFHFALYVLWERCYNAILYIKGIIKAFSVRIITLFKMRNNALIGMLESVYNAFLFLFQCILILMSLNS